MVRKRINKLVAKVKDYPPNRKKGIPKSCLTFIDQDANVSLRVVIPTTRYTDHSTSPPSILIQITNGFFEYSNARSDLQAATFKCRLILVALHHLVEIQESTVTRIPYQHVSGQEYIEKKSQAARRELSTKIDVDIKSITTVCERPHRYYDVIRYCGTAGWMVLLEDVASYQYVLLPECALCWTDVRDRFEKRKIGIDRIPELVQEWKSLDLLKRSFAKDSQVVGQLKDMIGRWGGDPEQLLNGDSNLAKCLRVCQNAAQERERSSSAPPQNPHCRDIAPATCQAGSRSLSGHTPDRRLDEDVMKRAANGTSIAERPDADCRATRTATISSHDPNTSDADITSINGLQSTAHGNIARQDTRGNVRRREDLLVGGVDQVTEGHSAVHKRRRVGNDLLFGQQPNGRDGMSTPLPTPGLEYDGLSMGISQDVQVARVDAGNGTIRATDPAAYTYSSLLGILDGTRCPPREMTSLSMADSLHGNQAHRTANDNFLQPISGSSGNAVSNNLESSASSLYDLRLNDQWPSQELYDFDLNSQWPSQELYDFDLNSQWPSHNLYDFDLNDHWPSGTLT